MLCLLILSGCAYHQAMEGQKSKQELVIIKMEGEKNKTQVNLAEKKKLEAQIEGLRKEKTVIDQEILTLEKEKEEIAKNIGNLHEGGKINEKIKKMEKIIKEKKQRRSHLKQEIQDKNAILTNWGD